MVKVRESIREMTLGAECRTGVLFALCSGLDAFCRSVRVGLRAGSDQFATGNTLDPCALCRATFRF